MLRSLLRTAIALAVGSPVLAAQLPYVTAPAGTLRLELGGSFQPSNREFADGHSRALGDPVTPLTALAGDLDQRLTALLGRPATPGSLGSLTSSVMHQHGAGTIGLAVGVTSRLTIGARIPIVSVRTEADLSHDPEGATLGVNPTFTGSTESATWVDQFDAALSELRTLRDGGAYADDPTRLALANQILTEGPTWRAGVAQLLVAPGDAALLLPLSTSVDGIALLDRARSYRDQLRDELGVTAPTALPALPTAAVTALALESLYRDPAAIGWAPIEEQPFVGFGDIAVSANYLLLDSRSDASRSWTTAWLNGGVTLPTGTPPRADRLRDQGTGDGQRDFDIGGGAEVGRGRFGLRGEINWTLQQRGSREVRVGARDAFVLPASATATLDWDPGEVLMVTARPFVRIADRLALVGSATWLTRGEDRWSVPEGATADAAAVAAMGDGTAASAVMLGAGISYAHDGHHVDGGVRMPVEAGLSVERTVTSGSGLVAQQLTTRLWFRVYKRLW